jgi:hypothetical protein
LRLEVDAAVLAPTDGAVAMDEKERSVHRGTVTAASREDAERFSDGTAGLALALTPSIYRWSFAL